MERPGPVYSFLWQMWHLKCFAFWCWIRIFSSSNSRLQYQHQGLLCFFFFLPMLWAEKKLQKVDGKYHRSFDWITASRLTKASSEVLTKYCKWLLQSRWGDPRPAQCSGGGWARKLVSQWPLALVCCAVYKYRPAETHTRRAPATRIKVQRHNTLVYYDYALCQMAKMCHKKFRQKLNNPLSIIHKFLTSF